MGRVTVLLNEQQAGFLQVVLFAAAAIALLLACSDLLIEGFKDEH